MVRVGNWRRKGEYRVYKPKGDKIREEIDVLRFRRELREGIKPNTRSYVIDFSKTHYISSATIGALQKFSQEIQERDLKVSLVPSPKIRPVFELINFGKTIPLYETLEDAILCQATPTPALSEHPFS